MNNNKQRLEKYSERFDNDKSAIGNPNTWGKRIIEEPKQETLEEVAKRYATDMSGTYYEDLYNAFINGAKWQQEQDKNKYSEEDMRKMYDLSCGKIGLSELHDQTENNQRFKDLLEKVKNK